MLMESLRGAGGPLKREHVAVRQCEAALDQHIPGSADSSDEP